jgi:hypothetical protein
MLRRIENGYPPVSIRGAAYITALLGNASGKIEVHTSLVQGVKVAVARAIRLRRRVPGMVNTQRPIALERARQAAATERGRTGQHL